MRTFDYSKLSMMKWDGDILRYIAKINECKGRQELYFRQNLVELDRLVKIARIQSCDSSNKIEGIVTTSSRMKQLVNDTTMPKTRDEKEIIGYRDVLNLIHDDHDVICIQSNHILQLHKLLLKHTGFSYGGKYKNVQNYINEVKADNSVVTRFTPVTPFETPMAIGAICESYQRTVALELVDPLILIATFVGDFLCIHPFNDGNGRMCRLLMLLLLYQNGYLVGKYISIEKEIENTKDLYYDALS
ncbi:MAG: Fic family protein, partial [Erysipelotrichaceae bacterium]